MLEFFSVLFVFSCIVWQAIMGRVCGGGLFTPPFGLAEFIYGLPYGITALVVALSAGATPAILILSFLLAMSTATLGKRLGHGQYFDLGTTTKYMEKHEKIDPIVSLFFGKDPNNISEGPGNYWRDFFGLTVIGFVVGFGLSAVLCFYGFFGLAMLTMVLSGMKSVAYAIGHKFFPGYHATEIGEYVSGAFGGLNVSVVCIIMIGLIFNV